MTALFAADPAGGYRCKSITIVPSIGSRVTVNDSVKTVHENESIYIPMGAEHRLENPGKITLELIEVQTGSYLGEDDIERLEDVYKRTTP